MNKVRIIALAASITLSGLLSVPAMADSTDANCEFIAHGDVKKGRSGPCSFSQSQGYVDIKLDNGQSISLTPGNKANHFTDQNGKKVVRTSKGESHKYEWDEKSIVVSFDGSGGQAGKQKQAAAEETGKTPSQLKDLVGMKDVQGEEQLSKRGYDFVKSEVSGESVYANWKNRKSGQCIAIRTVNGRYKSIINSLPYDCDN